MDTKKQPQAPNMVEKLLTELMQRMDRLEQMMGQNNLMKKDILNAPEATQFLGIKRSTLYKLTSTKVISFFKRGKMLYFKRAELEKYLTEIRVISNRELELENRLKAIKGR
jgi:excisionase family DNA binding protein